MLQVALNGRARVAKPRWAKMVLQWSMGQPNWSKLTEMINPLAGAALVTDADSLYLIGGWDGQQMHDEVWRLEAPAADGSLPAWQR